MMSSNTAENSQKHRTCLWDFQLMHIKTFLLVITMPLCMLFSIEQRELMRLLCWYLFSVHSIGFCQRSVNCTIFYPDCHRSWTISRRLRPRPPLSLPLLSLRHGIKYTLVDKQLNTVCRCVAFNFSASEKR